MGTQASKPETNPNNQLLLHLQQLTRRHPPSSSRGPPAPSRARPPSLARRDSGMISPAWRVLVQTSQWSAHGKPLETWSSVTWRNMELFRIPSSSLLLLPHWIHLPSAILFPIPSRD